MSSVHAIVEDFPDRRVYRIDRATWRAMIEAGSFVGKRAELIRGVILEMSPQKHPHAMVIENLNTLLIAALARRARVRCQLPLVAVDESEPEPDFAVVPPDDTDDHPRSAHLVVEVADSSLRFDRIGKRPLYAESGIPEYWIVDVAGRRVEVYREPRADAYAAVQIVDFDGELAIAAFPDVRIAVAALFEGVRA